MPKLLMVVNVPSMLSEFLLPYAQHFRAKGWQVDAMAGDVEWNNDYKQHFDKTWIVAWGRNPLDPRNFTKAPQMVREAVAKENYDIVHVHSPVAAFVTRYALRNKKNTKPVVIYTVHGFHFHRLGNPIKNQIFLQAEKIAAPWTDYMVVMNREDETSTKKHKMVPLERLLYMPGIGVDTRQYSPERVKEADVEKVRAELGLQNKQLILMIAEFNPGKRHRDALNAFAQLNCQDAVLAFAGIGPLTDEMKTLARQLGIAERVRFLGYRRDIPALLRVSSALLLPTEREGLPRSIMEALCMGTPVISTQIRGVEDLLENNAGLMTQVGDVPAIAKAMAWILEHPKEAKEMALRGQERMVREFDFTNVVKMHEELYAKALA